MRERANSLPCEIEKPLGYIVLFSGNAVVGRFVVFTFVLDKNEYGEKYKIYGKFA